MLEGRDSAPEGTRWRTFRKQHLVRAVLSSKEACYYGVLPNDNDVEISKPPLIRRTNPGTKRARHGELLCLSSIRYNREINRKVRMKTSANETRTNRLASIGSILVAVDLSEHSEATSFYAAAIAKNFDAHLTIVHVYEPVPLCEYASETTYTLLEKQREDLEELLDRLTKKIQTTGLICRSAFLIGEPAEQIATLARDIEADLIVTASHHPTFLSRLFNLDKATLILHRAPCPVLVCHDESTPGECLKASSFGSVRGIPASSSQFNCAW
jgi:universal stress protein A